MDRMLLLMRRSPDREAALRKLIQEQHTVGSASYRQWLTPQEFGRQFGPSEEDLSQLRKWLSSQGFQVNRTAVGGTVIEFSGTARQVRNAFNTEIHKYIIGNQEYWANNADPQIPAALAPVTHGIVSLHNLPLSAERRQAQLLNPVVNGRNGGIRPQFTFAASGCATDGNCYAVAPADLATIYNITPLWAAGIDGTGQTIAIASGSNIRPTDAHNFRQLFNLPSNDPVIFVAGTDPGIVPVQELFTNFAVQWAGAVAKNATIKLVVDQTTSTSRGIDLAALYVVDNNIAPVLTESWVACEDDLGVAGNGFYSSLWEQAAAEGITVIIPTGDTGSAACDSFYTETSATHGIAVNGVASTPFNVAVGGTDFNQSGIWSQFWNTSNSPTTQASAKSYIPERVYNDTCTENGPNGCPTVNNHGSDLIAGGGGLSKYNQRPPWQQGSAFSWAGSSRGLPDVSLFAGDGNDGSFFIICEEDAQAGGPGCDLNPPYTDFANIGGTTGSAAAFAGIMALINQKTGGRQGNANVILYQLAATPANGVFHDVTVGSNSVACVAGSPYCSNTSNTGYGYIGVPPTAFYAAYPGFDLATGWGSVDANNLVTQWSSIALSPTTTTLTNFNPSSFAHGLQTSFTVTVAPQSGTSIPTGDVALMVHPASGVPYGADFFTLQNGAVSASTAALPGGSYQVTAHYAGNGSLAPSDSAPVNVTVSPQASQVILSVPVNSGGALVCETNQNQGGGLEFQYGTFTILGNVNLPGLGPCDGVNLGATSPSQLTNFPTGTVQLTADGNPLDAGTYTLNARAHFEDHAASLSAGFHTLNAAYSGDASYAPSNTSAAPLSILVDPGSTTLSLTASQTTVNAGTNVTLTATVNTHSAGAPPTGTVTFTNGTTNQVLGIVNVFSNPGPNFQQALALLTFAPTATASIFASYSGDNNYAQSSAPPVTITSGSPDFVLAGNPLAITAGQTGTATITITPQFGYTGSVALSCPASASLPEGTTCAVSPSTVTLDSSGSPASATVSIQTMAPSVIAGPSAALLESRLFLNLSAGITLGALVVVLGWRRRSQALLMCTTISVIFLAGSCFGGKTAQNGGSLSNSSLSLTTSSVKSPQGAPLTLTAAVTANHAVTGTVDFLDAGTTIATGVPLSNGRATLMSSSLPVGTHSMTASYSGDATTNPSKTPSPLLQVITGNYSVQITATSAALNHQFAVQVTLQ